MKNRKARKRIALDLMRFFNMDRPPNARYETIEKLNRQAEYQCLYEKYANW